MKLVKRLLALVSVLAIILTICANLFFGVGGNMGLPFGYYGKLNRISQRLNSIPGLTIVEVGMHKDITLEDFWIDILIDGELHELAFENANIRTSEDLAMEFSYLKDDK